MPTPKTIHPADVVLVGTGIMSATLLPLLEAVAPGLRIHVFERLDTLAGESSDAWNNAGTGHAALCELNYTPRAADGHIVVDKAVTIAEQFELSKMFWAALARAGALPDVRSFVRPVPHVSFVRGERDIQFLSDRHDALAPMPLFERMELWTDRARIEAALPLVMEGRDPHEPVAVTHAPLGTDVNFGALSRALVLGARRRGVQVWVGHEVRGLERSARGFQVTVHERATGSDHVFDAGFVFLGAGGGTLPLLDLSGIPEADGYGGFPVGGRWLRCTNPAIVARHDAKVYGQAEVGSPPMSVPHLDTRFVDGERALLFGPFAGFSTKFLKHGSYLDLPASIEADNLVPLVRAGLANLDLTRYLVEQVALGDDERLDALRAYYPRAHPDDWTLAWAGQRVQVVKRDVDRGGVLEFGTELVTSADGRIAGLLGASPGASTAVAVMLSVLERCMPERLASPAALERLRAWVPGYGESLRDEPSRMRSLRRQSHETLGLVV